MAVATENPLLVRIARYEWGDSEAVISVRRSVGWSVDPVYDQFRRVAEGKRLVLVAEYDGYAVGTVTLEWNSTHYRASGGQRSAHISNLVVRPAHQRQGIGRALAEAAEEAAHSRGYSVVTIGVDQPQPLRPAAVRSLGLSMAEGHPPALGDCPHPCSPPAAAPLVGGRRPDDQRGCSRRYGTGRRSR